MLAADPDLTAAEQSRQDHIARQRIAERKAMEPTTGNTELKETDKAAFIKELMKPIGRVQAWAARTANGDVAA